MAGNEAGNENEAEQLFIRIYTDEHVTALLAPALRRRGYDELYNAVVYLQQFR